MNHYETGRHTPEFEVIKKIAEVLDLPVAYFYCEEDWLADEIIMLWQSRSRSQ